MGSYHYLVSSLPALSLEAPPPFSPEEFRFHCQGVLRDEDLEELDLLLAERAEEGRTEFSKAWAAGDAQIRNTAAKVRGAKLGVEAKPFLHSHRGYRVWLDREVSDALAKANPLGREMGMDGARWTFVEELALEDASGLPAVLGFALRLVLAERWAAMQEEAGREQLEKLVSQLEENAAECGAMDLV
ncbi:MAG: hypothetical protein DRP64_05655 [Verrucomicrobia bacterium]|nr:MAG: hypothetical protein DRP64_05655 [Verrucomicrobiota bacterium]